jgi:hypothetical protein
MSEMPRETQLTDSEDLRQALLDAEATCPRELPSFTADDLLAAARRRRSQSVKTRATVAAIGVAALTIVTTLSSKTPTSSFPPEVGVAAASSDLRDELAALKREAAIHQQVARQLIRDRQLAEHEAKASGADPVVASLLATQEASRSAAISLQYASIVEQESPDPHRARQEYERVTQRFPGTNWAALAAASLERLSFADSQRPTL